MSTTQAQRLVEWRKQAAGPIVIDDDGIKLLLYRYRTESPKGTVLLIHGASANSDTFLVPEGGLVAYLHDLRWDVWTLDWRGSQRVVDDLGTEFIGGSLASECALFTVDRVAEFDFPRALAHIKETLEREAAADSVPTVPAVVAHCFGAGSFSVAMARGFVEEAGVQNVVLSTLGLFYEVPWNGWIKVEDFIIERILGSQPKERAIDPRKSAEEWPAAMCEAYGIWPRSWLPSGEADADEVFQRLSFMFGEPYLRCPVIESGIHGPLLRDLFGGMHLGLYLHAGQMVRRGFADALNKLDVIDRSRLATRGAVADRSIGDLKPDHFRNKRITLITGAENHLWHRDSVDLMYEWLLGHDIEFRPVKHVLAGYGHQDLLWGNNAKTDVYRLIAEGIERR